MFHKSFPVALSEDESITMESPTKKRAVRHSEPPLQNPFELREAPIHAPSVDAHLLVVLGELNRLEELLLTSPKFPLTGKAMVAEDALLEQMDFIRAALPAALASAQEIVGQRDRILGEAQQQAQQILATADQKAFQLSNELGIVDRAREEARQIRQKMLAEAEQERLRVHQEMDQIRQQVAAECQQIQRDADEYTDTVLQSIEDHLADIQAKIRRGREHLRSS
jgi:vacuolar-type H+-ATPase subunit H